MNTAHWCVMLGVLACSATLALYRREHLGVAAFVALLVASDVLRVAFELNSGPLARFVFLVPSVAFVGLMAHVLRDSGVYAMGVIYAAMAGVQAWHPSGELATFALGYSTLAGGAGLAFWLRDRDGPLFEPIIVALMLGIDAVVLVGPRLAHWANIREGWQDLSWVNTLGMGAIIACYACYFLRSLLRSSWAGSSASS